MSDLPDGLYDQHELARSQKFAVSELRTGAKVMAVTVELGAKEGPLLDAAKLAISDALMACNRAVAVTPKEEL